MWHRRIAIGIRSGSGHFRISVLFATAILLNIVLAMTIAAAGSTATNAAGLKPGMDYWGDDQATPVVGGNVKNDIGTLPELTTVDEVLRLKPGEAERGYPVDLRGVVTCVVQEHNAFIVQDETRAVFVINAAPTTALPKRGELLEVQGKSDKGSFAPLVKMNRMTFWVPEPCRNRCHRRGTG